MEVPQVAQQAPKVIHRKVIERPVPVTERLVEMVYDTQCSLAETSKLERGYVGLGKGSIVVQFQRPVTKGIVA